MRPITWSLTLNHIEWNSQNRDLCDGLPTQRQIIQDHIYCQAGRHKLSQITQQEPTASRSCVLSRTECKAATFFHMFFLKIKYILYGTYESVDNGKKCS